MQHAQPIPANEAEAPFAVYLDAAKEQVARTRANGGTGLHPSRDGDIARALAVMNRDADRSARGRAA